MTKTDPDFRSLLPEELTVASDQSHPLFKPSALVDPDPALVTLIAERGFLGGAVEARPELAEDGKEVLVVEDGRQRTRACVLANKKRAKAGLDPVRLTVHVNRGDDDVTSYVRGIALNHGRRVQDPLEEAKEVAFGVSVLGLPKKQVAHLFGWRETDTVNLRLKLLQAPEEVKAAVAAGEITASDAHRIVRLKPEKQLQALKEIPKKAPGEAAAKKRRSPKAARKADRAKGQGASDKRPRQAQVVAVLDDLDPKAGPAQAAAHATLRWVQGLSSFKKFADAVGLPKDAPSREGV